MNKYLKSILTACLAICFTVCLGLFAVACDKDTNTAKNFNVTVLLPDNTPVAGVEVEVCMMDGSVLACISTKYTTNANGVAVIDISEQDATLYQVHLAKLPEGYKYADAQGNTFAASDGLTFDVTKSLNATIKLQSSAEPAVDVDVELTVTNHLGQPTAGVGVALTSDGTPVATDADGKVTVKSKSDVTSLEVYLSNLPLGNTVYSDSQLANHTSVTVTKTDDKYTGRVSLSLIRTLITGTLENHTDTYDFTSNLPDGFYRFQSSTNAYKLSYGNLELSGNYGSCFDLYLTNGTTVTLSSNDDTSNDNLNLNIGVVALTTEGTENNPHVLGIAGTIVLNINSDDVVYIQNPAIQGFSEGFTMKVTTSANAHATLVEGEDIGDDEALKVPAGQAFKVQLSTLNQQKINVSVSYEENTNAGEPGSQDNPYVATLGTPVTGHCNGIDEGFYVQFTATKTGSFTVTFGDNTFCTSEQLNNGENIAVDETTSYNVNLTAGDVLTLYLETNDMQAGDVTVTVTETPAA